MCHLHELLQSSHGVSVVSDTSQLLLLLPSNRLLTTAALLWMCNWLRKQLKNSSKMGFPQWKRCGFTFWSLSSGQSFPFTPLCFWGVAAALFLHPSGCEGKSIPLKPAVRLWQLARQLSKARRSLRRWQLPSCFPAGKQQKSSACSGQAPSASCKSLPVKANNYLIFLQTGTGLTSHAKQPWERSAGTRKYWKFVSKPKPIGFSMCCKAGAERIGTTKNSKCRAAPGNGHKLHQERLECLWCPSSSAATQFLLPDKQLSF